MYVTARNVRNSLLCSFIFASTSAFQIANADKVIPYKVPNKGTIYGNTATEEKWSVNSRKVRTTGYGTAGGATASRSSYGFAGRMTVSRAFFQAWLVYEVGSIGLEWIRQQYAEMPNAEFDPKNLVYRQKIPVNGYRCDINYCNWRSNVTECSGFQTSTQALQCGLDKSHYNGNYNKEILSSNCSSKTSCIAYYKYAGIGEIYNIQAYIWGDANYSTPWADYLTNNIDAGEPTLDPDPYLTAAILDRWAHIVPEMRERVSDTVDFVPSAARYTEKDVLGNVLKDYEGILEPVEEPIANPHKTAKRPEPEIEPTPQLKTKNLLNGNEIIQPTEPIKEPITKEDLTKLPASDKEVDLSKIEDAVTKTGAEPADPAIPELELSEWGEIEITTPEATDEQINEQAGKIRRTVTEEQVIAKAESLIGMHAFNYETFGSSRACPPPRKMRFLTVEFDLPFDLYCDYIKQIVLLMIGLIPLGVFIYFLKNLFIHG